MLKPEDIKVGTKLSFIDDEAKVNFIGTCPTGNKLLVDSYYDKGYFEVVNLDFQDDFVVGDSCHTDYISEVELRYFKLAETPEQSQLSEAAELIKDLTSGHEFDVGYINSGLRMRVSKFLHSIGKK